jgi:Escherichia/Staphylococcus phage prohead protease
MSKIFSPLLIEIKRGSVTDTGEFEAYASTFGPPADEVGDVIAKGAFTSALAIHRERGTMPALLFNHDTAEPIGKWLSLDEDEHGLLARGRLTLGTRRGAEALALLKDNALATSIGFSVAPGGAEQKNGIREIKRVAKLYEVSLVSIPANPRAQVKKPTNLKEFERALRDVGLSVREAKRVTAGGWYGYAREERSETDELLESLTDMKQMLKNIERTIEVK